MIVLDTNVLISALIKDSTTRKIIVESGLPLAYPEVSFDELFRHRSLILRKGGYDSQTFNTILSTLLRYITLISSETIASHFKQAYRIMEHIDSNDAVFVATALALNRATIWSDDRDFQRQTLVPILTTKELVNTFEK